MSERDSICATAEKPLTIRGEAVPGYRVSSAGFVMSQWKIGNNPINGRIEWTRGESWTALIPYYVHGYPTLAIRHAGKTIRVTVHRLVAEAFLGPCPAGQEVCHFDGNRANPAAANLRYDTRKANLADRERHGTAQRGERNPSATLTNEQANELRILRKAGEPLKSLAKRFGVTEATVSRIANGVRRA